MVIEFSNGNCAIRISQGKGRDNEWIDGTRRVDDDLWVMALWDVAGSSSKTRQPS
jgi:hypothetical protein